MDKNHTWTKERDELGFVHWLATPDPSVSMKVEKSPGGDYFVTAYKDGDVCGGEVLYFSTLAKAKREAEKIVENGTWSEYVLFPQDEKPQTAIETLNQKLRDLTPNETDENRQYWTRSNNTSKGNHIMSIPYYVNLKFPAPARLATLRRNFAEWFIRNPYAPRERVQSWRDVRFYTFKSRTGLFQGMNPDGPIWYANGDISHLFRRVRYADQVPGVNINHTGWYCDDEQGAKARGVIAALPHGRFLAGYELSDSDENVLYPKIFTDATDAARMADAHAEVVASNERDYQARFRESEEIRDKLERAEARLRIWLILRHNLEITNRHGNARENARGIIAEVRALRERLNTEFKDFQ